MSLLRSLSFNYDRTWMWDFFVDFKQGMDCSLEIINALEAGRMTPENNLAGFSIEKYDRRVQRNRRLSDYEGESRLFRESSGTDEGDGGDRPEELPSKKNEFEKFESRLMTDWAEKELKKNTFGIDFWGVLKEALNGSRSATLRLKRLVKKSDEFAEAITALLEGKSFEGELYEPKPVSEADLDDY